MIETLACVGFPGYAVDADGNVYNSKTKRKMKQQKNKSGYLTVTLGNGRKKKTYLAHRLVAITFLENKDNLPEVNHKDENKTNNRVDNLEWCTHRYNSYYGNNAPAKQMNSKIHQKAYEATRKTVVQITKDGGILQEFSSTREASEMTGVGRSNIQKCCSPREKNKTAGGFQWKYKEGK